MILTIISQGFYNSNNQQYILERVNQVEAEQAACLCFIMNSKTR